MPQPSDRTTKDLAEIPVPWSGSADTASQFDVWQIALRNKFKLILGLILGLVAGELTYIKLGPSFQASTRINVSKPASVQRDDENTATSSGDRGEHPALIKSPMLIADAIRMGKLDELSSLATIADPDDRIEEILDYLEVKRISGQDRSSFNIFELSMENRQRGNATQILNSIVDAYSEFLTSTRRKHSDQSIKELTRACDELNEQIEQKKKDYLEFRRTAPLLWNTGLTSSRQSGSATNVYQERVKDIERDRNLVNRTRIEVVSKIKTLESAIAKGEDRASLEILVRRFLNLEGGRAEGFGIPELNGQTALQVLESRLMPLVLDERKLLRTLGPDHPDVVNIRKSIQTIYDYYAKAGVTLPDPEQPLTDAERQALAEQKSQKTGQKKIDPVQVYLASLRHELAVLDSRDKSLASDFDVADKEARAASRFQIEDQDFMEAIDHLTEIWDAQTAKLTQARFVEDNGGYRLKVISPCQESLSAKRHMKIVVVVSVVGLALAFGVSWFGEWRANSFRTVDEFQQAVGLPVIGRIPRLNLSAVQATAAETGVHPSLYYLHLPGSSEAEAYRSVRTTLYVCTHVTKERVLQITSPEPEDGKSTLACNLALAIAQSGKKVVLVDADLRRPKVHLLFGLRKDIGLSDVLAGEIEWRNAVVETKIPKLSILPAGQTPASPAELLATTEFETLLNDLRKEYDFVLVDTPPLLAVSDPCVVAAATDGLVLVVNLTKNRRDAIRRVQEMIATHGMRVLGVVANGVTAESDSTGHYAYGNGDAAGYFPKDRASRVRQAKAALPAEPVQV
ncbi:MAG: polysaccharide biosynthesis tyrosine autokinase [Planctomycetales bacterium]|nr:polysaccharide biosynthesis tyrosine autokinase [Planctomycetales bacterium]